MHKRFLEQEQNSGPLCWVTQRPATPRRFFERPAPPNKTQIYSVITLMWGPDEFLYHILINLVDT